MCHLCPIIHLQYEDALLPRCSKTWDESWAPSQHKCLLSREGWPVPSCPRRPSEAEERRVKGQTGSRAAPQTEPGWQVPSVRSNAESPVVKPALGVSGSSAASCPECCSGSSSGALLASPLSSAGLCKKKIKDSVLCLQQYQHVALPHLTDAQKPIHRHYGPLQAPVLL